VSEEVKTLPFASDYFSLYENEVWLEWIFPGFRFSVCDDEEGPYSITVSIDEYRIDYWNGGSVFHKNKPLQRGL